ncbi:SDR family NAD(P)-dependent oxidoreductase [Chelatococcus asaccharovorans]|uniref:NAD(P)-dependent dehydrogenase (Short-subunit alcohol dehydrogenase family) n=1 Tax=Chelatococcus asaccharovorans TaxID=28210 RepID=A0A2V3TS83_9HYPH|nr:glucose 1-dehydrogenase [Chelatococcus asaccharovorans]MBS7707851.1 glucose 1-dehydrogenase [Chelatococcus asaccharovorans]PXW50902.1 NAD(P)-dependent dehydrogenase (short-subunit alcohol dehydrogenase family) [Chelatococcus asaccharovorans]
MDKLSSISALLRGQRVLVTGAAQGNGRGIADGMAAAGASVIFADLNGEGAVAAARACGSGASSLTLNIADRDECQRAAEEVEATYGPIDCLVNNAGILARGPIDSENADAHWDRTLAVNVTGTYNVVRAFLSQLKARKGNIINIGSIQSFVATPNSAAYTASKGAILMFTKALAAELATSDVRVNGIAPGFIRTPMTEATFENERALKGLLHHIPLKRVGEPEDLAGAAIFLASPLASYVTGVMLPVDGGYLTV